MVRKAKTEAVTPPEVITDLLNAAGPKAVLIGGQALGVWVYYYGLGLPAGLMAISNDSDFLAASAADRALVSKFARALNGHEIFPNKRALTALVGQAVLDISDDEIINVDVLFSVFGLDATAVRKRAVEMDTGTAVFKVMHPLDVLRSRLANLYKIKDKQNEKGEMQLRMAIDVAREHLREQAKNSTASHLGSGRSPLQPLVSEIERMAVEDAGRKVAKRHGIHVADAVDPSLIPAGPFWEKKWPTLRTLMSAAYADGYADPGG